MTAKTDLHHGRGGGRSFTRTPAEEAIAFQAAVAKGEIVRARCACRYWWVTHALTAESCGHCGEPMVAT